MPNTYSRNRGISARTVVYLGLHLFKRRGGRGGLPGARAGRRDEVLALTLRCSFPIQNCILSGNESTNGAGLYIEGQTNVQSAGLMINNNFGSGIRMQYAQLNIDDAIIERNSSHGIHLASGAMATIIRTMIELNE